MGECECTFSLFGGPDSGQECPARRDMRCSLIRACFRFRYLLEEVARTDCDDKGLADVKKM